MVLHDSIFWLNISMSENSTEIGTVTDGGSFGGRWITALDEEWMLQLFVKSVLLVEEDASDKFLNRLGYFASETAAPAWTFSLLELLGISLVVPSINSF